MKSRDNTQHVFVNLITFFSVLPFWDYHAFRPFRKRGAR